MPCPAQDPPPPLVGSSGALAAFDTPGLFTTGGILADRTGSAWKIKTFVKSRSSYWERLDTCRAGGFAAIPFSPSASWQEQWAGTGRSSATLGWLPVLAVSLCESPLPGRALSVCEQPGFALFQQGSSCHLFGEEKHPGADTKPSSSHPAVSDQRDHSTCGHCNPAHPGQGMKSQPQPV